MNSDLIRDLCNLGIYSDLELTINNKLYKLHKFLIYKSIFFKTLINNINNMSIEEKIEILDVNGELIESIYVDNIIKWLYHGNADFMGNIELQYNEKFDEQSSEQSNGQSDEQFDKKETYYNLKETLKYYYVADFLQIDEMKNIIVANINDGLDAMDYSQWYDCGIIKNHYGNYEYNGDTYSARESNHYKYIMEVIYDKLKKVKHLYTNENDFGDLFTNENGFGNNDQTIYNEYMRYVYEGDKKRFSECYMMKCDYMEEIVGAMYKICNKLYVETYLSNNPSPKITLEMEDIESVIDIVHDYNKPKLVQLLKMENFIDKDGVIDWNMIKVIDDFCIKHKIRKAFTRKVQAFMYLFVYDK